MSSTLVATDLKVIDTDTHVSEPPDLWTSRVPAKWRDKVPHVELNPETGHQHWRIGDSWLMGTGFYAVAGAAGIGHLVAAEGAMHDQADIVGRRLVAGPVQQAEAKAPDDGERLAGLDGERVVKLGLGHGSLSGRPGPGAPAPDAHREPARTRRGTAGPGGGGW